MKSGIIRTMDNLGRICIPKEVRTALDIKDFENIEIVPKDGHIELYKYTPAEEAKNAFNTAQNVILKNLNEIGKKDLKEIAHQAERLAILAKEAMCE